MVLAVNAENTYIALGGFTEGELRFHAHIATAPFRTADQYACDLLNMLALYHMTEEPIEGAVLCSVVPSISAALTEALRRISGHTPMNIASGVRTGLNLKIDNPRQLGSDLVCLAVEAAATLPKPCLVVAADTATTFTALDASGTMVGSAIAPGLSIGLAALRTHAAQLPSIRPEVPEHGVMGRNTIESMRSGVLFGHACMIDGMVQRFAAALGGSITVALTGTHSELLAPQLHTQVRLCPELALHGLYRIWKKNKKRKS
ncbi:MAG: type III pantothenate kinase [Butyricicoccaceae bacterium]